MTNGQPNILSIENLSAGYEKKDVLQNVNLKMYPGEVCAVVGEEGSGKSTLQKAIVQQLKYSGYVFYQGKTLLGMKTHQLLSTGIDYLVQGGNILKHFTVREHINLMLPRRSKAERQAVWEKVSSEFILLKDLENQIAGRLSGGQRMILSMGCIAAGNSRLLILDEPSAGLAEEIVELIADFLLRLKKEQQISILLLEHNYDFVKTIADSIVFLKEGHMSPKFGKSEFAGEEFIYKNLYSIT